MSWRTFGPYRVHYRAGAAEDGVLRPLTVAFVTVEVNPERIAELLGPRAARNRRRRSVLGPVVVVTAEVPE